MLLSLLVTPSGAQVASSTSDDNAASGIFEKQCYSCHNIGGGDKRGPDLKNVTKRRDREWLHRFILSPQNLKRAGDRTANQLFAKYAPEVMPDQALSREQIDQVLEMIQRLSEQNKTFIPQTGKLSRRPLPADIPVGRRLFTGQMKLSKGGPACISCHHIAGVGILGGGTLGPDLTNVNSKYNEVELASILKAPSFPTMSKLFANHELSDEEVVQIFAFLRSVARHEPGLIRAGSSYLTNAGVGVIFILALMSFAWRARLRSVRKQLLRRHKR